MKISIIKIGGCNIPFLYEGHSDAKEIAKPYINISESLEIDDIITFFTLLKIPKKTKDNEVLIGSLLALLTQKIKQEKFRNNLLKKYLNEISELDDADDDRKVEINNIKDKIPQNEIEIKNFYNFKNNYVNVLCKKWDLKPYAFYEKIF